MDYEDLKPAPEPLKLVQRFVNTRNYLYGGDRLENVEEASAWLVECGLLDAREQLGELGRQCLVNFREGLRGLLLAHNHRSEVNVRALNNLIASTTLKPTFGPDGRLTLESSAEGGPADRVLGRLLSVLVRAEADGAWKRLKACRNDDCRWAFYDVSRNRSGSWCDMAVCGVRHKMRAYRKRKSEAL